MKALVLHQYGAPEDPAVLSLEDLPLPEPGPGQVRVRVRAASINDWDWSIVTGQPFLTRFIHGVFSPKIRIPGCDVAGVVDAVGEGVSQRAGDGSPDRAGGDEAARAGDGPSPLRVGDEVYGDLSYDGFGTFAEYVCCSVTSLVPKPPSMSFEEAAALPQAAALAYQGLVETGGLRSRMKVLLNGAGGGVGTLALQLIRLRHDIEVTAVDGAGKLELLRELGADRVLDYRKTDFTKTGDRYDLILDVKTNRSALAYARALSPGGVYATVGGDIPRFFQLMGADPVLSWLQNKRLRIVALKANRNLEWFNERFEAGEVKPVIDRVYALDDAAEGLRYYGTASQKGKVVVRVG